MTDGILAGEWESTAGNRVVLVVCSGGQRRGGKDGKDGKDGMGRCRSSSLSSCGASLRKSRAQCVCDRKQQPWMLNCASQ